MASRVQQPGSQAPPEKLRQLTFAPFCLNSQWEGCLSCLSSSRGPRPQTGSRGQGLCLCSAKAHVTTGLSGEVEAPAGATAENPEAAGEAEVQGGKGHANCRVVGKLTTYFFYVAK